MSQVLYRQHRPQSFADVLGQEHVVRTLKNQLKSSQIAHAYLFTGPRGVGKTSIARILARAANCQNGENHEPDNTCTVCQEMIEGRSLDLTEIDAASHTGVDNIRDLIEHLPVPPTKAKYRTFIIDEVHMLSKGAFNALLKTLEEPPAHALFILATTEVHKIPATVISRTQRFDFKRLTSDEISERLRVVADRESMEISEDVLTAIAQSVDGGMRDALVLLEKARHLLADQDTDAETAQKLLGITPIKLRQDFLDLLKKKDLPAISEFIKRLSSEGYSLEQFNKDFLEHIRSLMSEKLDGEMSAIAEHFLSAYQNMRIAPVPELPLMVAAVKVVEGDRAPVVKQVAAIKPAPAPQTTQSNPEPAKQPTAPAKANISGGSVSQGEVEEKWMDILDKVRQYNQSLLAALKLAQPISSVNGTVTIAFPYKFHAETVNAAKNRLVIERVFEEIFGQRITIHCIAQKDATPPSGRPSDDSPVPQEEPAGQDGAKGDDDLLNSALSVLGGEVVED